MQHVAWDKLVDLGVQVLIDKGVPEASAPPKKPAQDIG